MKDAGPATGGIVDLKRGPTVEIGPKDFFEIASTEEGNHGGNTGSNELKV
ncbi:MAG: hypothetical protein V3S89_08115 [Desulfobacterales bacterium]